MRNKTLVALVVMFAVGVAACGGSDGGSSSDSGGGTPSSGPTTVMAPAAFKPTLDQLVTAFKAANPDATVEVTPQDNAGTLSAAVTGGDASVVITSSNGLEAPSGTSTGSFGRNLAVIGVPDANPKNVKNVTVFKPGSGAKTVVCSTKTSLGDFSQLVLSKSQVTPAPATVEHGAELRVQRPGPGRGGIGRRGAVLPQRRQGAGRGQARPDPGRTERGVRLLLRRQERPDRQGVRGVHRVGPGASDPHRERLPAVIKHHTL